MIKWYDLSLVYLVSGIILVLVNQVFRIIPPHTKNGWVVLLALIVLIVAGWWIVLAPYLGFELTLCQFKHVAIAAMIQYPMNYFLFRPFLRD
jgi:hypothetical protein